ncbi:MAG: hypothetical protein LBP79_01650 [Clostridiales bacterium]|jgi:hypothetical protein|nr:hypothetical protein [Clostridiales bacterium]
MKKTNKNNGYHLIPAIFAAAVFTAVAFVFAGGGAARSVSLALTGIVFGAAVGGWWQLILFSGLMLISAAALFALLSLKRGKKKTGEAEKDGAEEAFSARIGSRGDESVSAGIAGDGRTVADGGEKRADTAERADDGVYIIDDSGFKDAPRDDGAVFVVSDGGKREKTAVETAEKEKSAREAVEKEKTAKYAESKKEKTVSGENLREDGVSAELFLKAAAEIGGEKKKTFVSPGDKKYNPYTRKEIIYDKADGEVKIVDFGERRPAEFRKKEE